MSPSVLPKSLLARRRRPCAGVTLVELVIVLMVMGILTAAAAPKFFDSLSRYRVEAAAKRVAHDLRLARRHAKSVSADQTVEFNSPSLHQYELTGMDDPHRPGQSYVVSVTSEPYVATIVAVDFGGDDILVFDGHGQPDSGGSITVQSGSHQRVISVNAETGKVDVS